MNDQFLFVYGTLRRGSSDMHQLLAEHTSLAGEATYQGKLYKIDYYPGVVPSDDASDVVHGEVYRLHDPDLILSMLDEYEECGPNFPQPTEFVRRIQSVRLKDGGTVPAWVYLYNLPTDEAQLVPSGDFLKIAAE